MWLDRANRLTFEKPRRAAFYIFIIAENRRDVKYNEGKLSENGVIFYAQTLLAAKQPVMARQLMSLMAAYVQRIMRTISFAA